MAEGLLAHNAADRFEVESAGTKPGHLPYRPASGEGKKVQNFRWKFQAFAKAVNFSPWPKDCLRHSYASYHLAKFKDAADIEKFWKLTPP